jgi:hypothetical protein
MAANRPDPRDAILDRFEAGEITKEQADAEARTVRFISILDRFEAGEITREQADAEARAAGSTSMERSPDFSGVDCWALPSWTMPQLMRWVIYRSSEEVLPLVEEYRMQTRIWQGEIRLNERGEKIVIWRLRPPPSLSLYDVAQEADSREKIEGRASCALRLRSELKGQFLQGVLTAYGKLRRNGEHCAIPKTAWATIDLFDLPCNHFDSEDIGREGEETPRYFDVYMIPQDVLLVWPRHGSQAQDVRMPVENTKLTKPEVLARLLLERFPGGRPSLTAPQLMEMLMEEAKPLIGTTREITMRRAIGLAWPTSSKSRQTRSGST